MYGPSFITGSLIARFGAPTVVAIGLTLEAVAATIGLSGITAMHFWATLMVLGMGWNFGFVGASALVLETHLPQERNKVQAFKRFPGVRHHGGRLVLLRPAACQLRLVGGEHGGLPAGRARPRRAGADVVRASSPCAARHH